MKQRGWLRKNYMHQIAQDSIIQSQWNFSCFAYRAQQTIMTIITSSAKERSEQVD